MSTKECISIRQKSEDISSITKALSAIADKWTVPILLALNERALRFNELQRVLGEVTHRVLTTQLRKLESEQLVVRTVHSVNPPHVVYEIAPEGENVLPILCTLASWQTARQEKQLAPAESIEQEQLETSNAS